MHLFYLFALIPLIAWIISFYLQKGNIHFWETLIGTAVAFLVALIFNLSVGFSMTQDKEMWSGSVVTATHVPSWTEYYEEAVYKTEMYTDSEGNIKSKRVFSHWSAETRFHNEYWHCSLDYGSEYGNINIDKAKYDDIKFRFGGTVGSVPGKRRTSEHNSRLKSGDPNDYPIINSTSYVYPVNTEFRFENRVIAAPTVYNFEEVPNGSGVYDWPNCSDVWCSNRVIGTAASVFPITFWDQLNSRLGPMKRVNLIIIGFGQSDISLGYLQQAKFKGGKKNDLVITYGGSDPKNPEWALCFGWTDKNLVKKNIESIILRGNLSYDKTINEIETEVVKNYELKNFEEDFKYITIEPKASHFIIYFIVMIITQAGLHLLFSFNNWKLCNRR